MSTYEPAAVVSEQRLAMEAYAFQVDVQELFQV
jgi:hypothetical protein